MYICINIVLSPFLPFDYTTEIYHPIETSRILEHPAVSIWGKMKTGSRFQPAKSEMPVSIGIHKYAYIEWGTGRVE